MKAQQQDKLYKQEETIESLRIVLEDLAHANDSLIILNDEKENFSYKTAMKEIASARSELLSELVTQREKLNEITEQLY